MQYTCNMPIQIHAHIYTANTPVRYLTCMDIIATFCLSQRLLHHIILPKESVCQIKCKTVYTLLYGV